MNRGKTNGYDNESGYVPGEFSEPIYQFDKRTFNDDHIYVPFWESDEDFVS